MSSRGLEAHLRRLTLSARQVKDFDQLPTPFRAVATDMESGQAVIMRDGDLATALRSSMSVPGVFSPLEVNGRILGDGGLVNNTPVDVARAMGAQRLIVVNIGTHFEQAGNAQYPHQGDQSDDQHPDRTERAAEPARLKSDDILIAPELEGMTSADF